MAVADINGTTLSFDERGKGQPLALIHGFPLDRRMWADLLHGLSQNARVIAPDLRGFGESRSSSPFTIESLANDLHALLSQRGMLPCVLGGLSMGGYVALAFAKKYPADLRGLLLIDTRAEADTAQGKQARDQMIELVRSKGSAAVAEAMLPKMLAPATIHNNPYLTSHVRDIMNGCPPLTIEHALQAMRERPDLTSALASIPVPTHIIVGESDAITPPEMAQSMCSQIACAGLTIVPGAGHLTPMENPAKVNEAIGTFLATLKG